MSAEIVLGIDLGTSSVKVVVVDSLGQVAGTGQERYPTAHPEPRASEQDPDDWWRAAGRACRAALALADSRSVAAIGVTGQMHGTVLVDAGSRPLAPAIIWSDGRGVDAAAHLTSALGAEHLIALPGSPVASGFQAATLLWLRETAPDLVERASRVTTPGGYLRLMLTGEHSVDPSDASGTLLFDVHERRWSTEIAAAVGIDVGLLPTVVSSAEIAGTVTPAAAVHLGIDPGIPVAAGGADAACAALGSGVTDPASVLLTFSTGAQVLQPRTDVATDPLGRLHTFCSAVPPGPRSPGWYTMGATLAAGMALSWLSDQILQRPAVDSIQSLIDAADAVPAGSRGVVFLPHLIGERTPLMDPSARGAYIGLSVTHDQADLARATVEGIAFATYDAFLALRELGQAPQRIVLAGGGARFGLWRQIVADLFDLPAVTLMGDDQTAIGAAILAGAAIGWHDPVSAAMSWRTEATITTSNPRHRETYRDLFGIYQRSHRALRADMHALALLGVAG